MNTSKMNTMPVKCLYETATFLMQKKVKYQTFP